MATRRHRCRASPRTRRWWRAALVGLLLVGGGVAATIVFTGESGPSAPAEWDPRVLGLVAFVEDERGLTFEHPVAVQFLDGADYEADVRAEFDGVADDDTETLEVGAGMFRALGLAEGDLDLLEATEEVSANGELGRYLLESDRIVIRGADLDVRTSATVVHELTHALQDQVFEIGRRLDDDAGRRRRGPPPCGRRGRRVERRGGMDRGPRPRGPGGARSSRAGSRRRRQRRPLRRDPRVGRRVRALQPHRRSGLRRDPAGGRRAPTQ